MMKKSDILENIRNWNPETDSVNMLKELIAQCGGLHEDILKIFFVIDPYAIEYGEFSCDEVAEYYGVIAIDFEGNCLYNEGREVKSISELQEAYNAIKN